MSDLVTTAAAFRDMAHRIVWCTASTVDSAGRPRTRVLHPMWEWEDDRLIGWIATGPTPVKRSQLERTPFMSCSYWATSQDTCAADCAVAWCFDDETRTRIWEAFAAAPAPLGYDPAIIPAWTEPTADSFAVLRLDPYRLRVFPGSVLFGQGGDVLHWQA